MNPYYLVAWAQEVGDYPVVILAGHSINDSIPGFVARRAMKGLDDVGKVIKGLKVLIMGLTYKENVPDIRTSPIEDIVKELKDFEVYVYGHDPILSDSVIMQSGATPPPGARQKKQMY